MKESDIEKGKLVEDGGIVEALEKNMGAKLRKASPVPASCCIFRVPQVLRRQKKEAYTPDIVTIGPFHAHRVRKQFEVMQNVKNWYLQGLLSRNSNVSLKSLIKQVVENKYDKRARECYADPLDHLDQKALVEMLVLDGCFLLELFRKVDSRHCCLQDENDPIFSERCMLQYLYHDLLLLENQLPWFVLECLYNLTVESINTRIPSLVELVLNFFRQAESHLRLFPQVTNLPFQVLHILDLLRTVIVLGFKDQETPKKEKMEPKLPQRIPSATALREAGVKFVKHPQPNCIMDIHFKKGVFTIPSLAIDETTAPLFRNLIAFEQCYYGCLHKITSYAFLMDNLIDLGKDADLLCDKDILANWLSAEDAVKFFNDLYNDTTVCGFYYETLCNDVNDYYDKKWYKWMEKFRRDHFSTPCAIISFIAAFILLLLTLLQTIFTITGSPRTKI